MFFLVSSVLDQRERQAVRQDLGQQRASDRGVDDRGLLLARGRLSWATFSVMRTLTLACRPTTRLS